MTRRAVIPPAMAGIARDWRISPGVISGGHLFLNGFNGSAFDGSVSADPEVQIDLAFDKVALVLAAADLGFADIVEMTSFHLDLADHIDIFRRIRARRLGPPDPISPDPAWTAIEVAGLAMPGVIVELRIIAALA